jgi:hypothetical protein
VHLFGNIIGGQPFGHRLHQLPHSVRPVLFCVSVSLGFCASPTVRGLLLIVNAEVRRRQCRGRSALDSSEQWKG